MDCGWLWSVNVRLSVVTKVPFWWGMWIMGEAMHIWGKDIWGICVPPQFYCERKITIFKKYFWKSFLLSFWKYKGDHFLCTINDNICHF